MRLRCVIRPSEGAIVPESVRCAHGALSYEVELTPLEASNGTNPLPEPFTLGPLRVIPERSEVETPDGRLTLNRREMTALVLLGANPGVTVTKQMLKASAGWPPDVATRACDSHVSRLRVKLRPYGIRIVNVWGYGWYLTAPNGARAEA